MSDHDQTVDLDPPYPVRLRRSFAQAWEALREDQGDRSLFILIDRKVARKQPDALAGLSTSEAASVVKIEGGEKIKNLRHLDALVAKALDARIDRRSLVVAVGGGTVGDLAGYFAASYMRGIDWVPLATTVISLADSAVGGKTGVNSHGLKNLLGAFHQPVGVYGALEALSSLPRRHRIGGLAEVVKCGMIVDPELFELLERGSGELVHGESDAWFEILGRAVAVKAGIVSRDPREAGERELLNFGHTLGHALEATAQPVLHHGEAVSLGMIAASSISVNRGLASESTSRRLESLLGQLGLPQKSLGLNVETALEAVGYDKKVWDRQVRMVLTRGIGSATVGHAVERPELSQALTALKA